MISIILTTILLLYTAANSCAPKFLLPSIIHGKTPLTQIL